MKSHRNCTVILPAHSGHRDKNLPRWFREQTHGCWCSAWRVLKNGKYRIWRRGAWRKPKPGELRTVKHPEWFS